VYAVADHERRTATALDSGGRIRPGWPVSASIGRFGDPVAGAAGSVVIGECPDSGAGCVLHQYDASGSEPAGWPFEVPVDLACVLGPCLERPLVGPDGTIHLPLRRPAGRLDVLALDHAGSPRPGWPIHAGAPGLFSSDPRVGPDGTLFVHSEPDDGTASANLDAWGPDGRRLAGWPASMAALSRYVIGRDGAVVVWSLVDDVGELCPNPGRTLFTRLGAGGDVSPGWPRGSTGLASEPVVAADGTLHYVSARGNVYAHDAAGDIKDGWPFPIPEAVGGCGPARPYLAPDGTVVVATDHDRLGSSVNVVGRDGRARPGWPVRPGDLGGPCLDSECFGGAGAPAIGSDGTVYVVVFTADAPVRADVLALDPQGRTAAGWPVRLTVDPSREGVSLIGLTGDGRLLVRAGDRILSLDADGGISD
jgi:hypothetical protein